ncbi:MAG: hypothetical protein Crog4KO_34800 [Crocinitomicaceae bacterium]
MPDLSIERFLHEGMVLEFNAEIYKILSYNLHDLTLSVQHIRSNTQQVFHLSELLEQDVVFAESISQLEHRRKKPQAIPADIDLPKSLLEHADQIVKTVETVEHLISIEAQYAQRYHQEFCRTPAIQHALARLDPPIALSTYYKYLKRYQENDGVRNRIAASLRRKSYNQIKVTRVQLHFIDTLILRYYARQRPLRPMTVYRLGQSILERTQNHWVNPEKTIPDDLIEELLDTRLPIQLLLENVDKRDYLIPTKMPSRGWFYNYLRWFEAQPELGKQVVTTRYGVGVWEKNYQIFDTFVPVATRPLQYVFADHWLLDVFTVDDVTRSKLNRLWLTVLIDVYSRSVLGMALLYEQPGIMSIQRALQHAIWPKNLPADLRTHQLWTCYGIPQQLYLDNAWAHHSHSLEQLTRTLGQGGKYNTVDLVFRPPYHARYGALIERFFGNLSSQMKEHLPGAILSSEYKHLRQAAQQACLLYQDVQHFLYKVILTYQHTPHRELQGMTPHQVWCEGLSHGLPLVPPQTPEVTRAFLRLAPRTRILTSKGVNAFGMQYWSAELGGIARIGRDGKHVHYHYRYDPQDISQIALFRDGIWIGDAFARQLRQPDGSTRPLSLLERELAKELAREQQVPLQHWLAFVHEIDVLTQTRQAEKRQKQSNPIEQPMLSITTQNSDINQLYTDLLTGFITRTEEA